MNKQIDYKDYYILLHMDYFLRKPLTVLLKYFFFWLFFQVQDWTNATPTTGKVQTKTKACMVPLEKKKKEFPLY